MNSVQITEYDVTNNGSMDISGKSFSVPMNHIVLWENTSTPNENDKNVSITTDGKILTVSYKYLPAGSHHKFWIARAADYPLFKPKFAPDSPGVIVTNSPDDLDTSFPWFWAGMLIASFVIFLFGVGAHGSSVASDLKKRGFDYNDMMKQPVIK